MRPLLQKSCKAIWIIVATESKKTRQAMSIKKSTSLAIAAVLVLGAASVLYVVREARKPTPIADYSKEDRSKDTTVVIPNGATGDQIASILFDAGVVKSARAFFAAATSNERSTSIQPGTYSIATKIPGDEAVRQLLDKSRRLLVLLIREGERSYEIADELEVLNFTKSEIEVFLSTPINVSGFGNRDVEGFLFPATYNLVPGEGLSSVRERLTAKFSSVLVELDFMKRAKERGLSPYEALTLASIVQAEGFSESDFRKVAQVIYNRIEAGMPLQMDSTILYALRERRIAVTNKDLKISSKFNTYRRQGLPPTPIGNPGKAALDATLNPEQGDWLYFVTTEPAITKFTASYQEFLRFKREFKANLKAGKFDGAE